MKNKLLIIGLCLYAFSSYAAHQGDGEDNKKIESLFKADIIEYKTNDLTSEKSFIAWFNSLAPEEQAERYAAGIYNMTDRDVKPGEPKHLHALFRNKSYDDIQKIVDKIILKKEAKKAVLHKSTSRLQFRSTR